MAYEPIKQAFDLFGNDVTAEKNAEVRANIKKAKRKEAEQRRREARKAKKLETDKRKKTLSDILMYDEDLFGEKHTPEEKEKARKELASLENNGRKKVKKIVREAVRDALKSFL